METTLTPFEKDQLGEIVNISASKAATALSKMIHDLRVDIGVPEVFVDLAEKVPGFIGSEKEVRTSVMLSLSYSIPGILLFTFPPQSALKLAGLLSEGHNKDLPILDEIDRTALCTMGDTLAGAMIESLSKFLNIEIIKSVPDIATDMLGSLVDAVVVDMSARNSIIMSFRVAFWINLENEKIEGQMLFLFEPNATKSILASLKAKYPNL